MVDYFVKPFDLFAVFPTVFIVNVFVVGISEFYKKKLLLELKQGQSQDRFKSSLFYIFYNDTTHQLAPL